MKFLEKLARFFMGRYGIDSLYTALTFTAFGIMIVNLFIGSFWLHCLVLALLFWSMFRSLSKNIPARRRENEVWLKIWKKITFGKGPVRRTNPYGSYGGYGSYGNYQPYGGYGAPPRQKKPKKPKLKTDKDHCFRICPDCRANIRLPKQKGKHTVVCPRCKCRFEVKI